MEKEWATAASAPGFGADPNLGGSGGYHPPSENPPGYYAQAQATPFQQQPMGYQPYTQGHNQYLPPQAQQTVIQVVSQPLPAFGPRPANTRCPFCQQDVMTYVTRRHTGSTHLAACGLCFFCMCCCPYICDCFSDAEHECPNCNKFLGVYTQPSGRRY